MAYIRYSEEQKLNFIKEYLESDLTSTQFCNVNKISRASLYQWLNWYNEKKEAWQLATLKEDKVEETVPSFKETNDKLDDEEFHKYRNIIIDLNGIRISCDKSSFKEIWGIIK